jgi:hypothetical protein
MSTPGDKSVDGRRQSAGEHEWREIHVAIHPRQGSSAVRVSARKSRGADLVVDRRLGVFGFAPGALELTATAAGCMRAAAEALLLAADRLDRS